LVDDDPGSGLSKGCAVLAHGFAEHVIVSKMDQAAIGPIKLMDRGGPNGPKSAGNKVDAAPARGAVVKRLQAAEPSRLPDKLAMSFAAPGIKTFSPHPDLGLKPAFTSKH
jgi:hypothetical protein